MPRDGVLTFSDHGFIPEPEDDDLPIPGSGVIAPFEKIAQIPCLALLGEPGIGKTESLRALPPPAVGTERLRIDLAAYSSDYMLQKAIFEAPEFAEWINSAHTLELVLDSLDECLVHVRTIARLLVEEFAKYPRSRLRLRIACRTAEWPELLSQELPHLWGEGQYAAYELAPLTRRNVRDAAAAEGLNAELFLQEIERREIAALAMKPITLLFLLHLRHDLPETQSELYRQGCLRLCGYENLDRLASAGPSDLNSEERLAIAERVAAITMFGKRSAIFIGSNEKQAKTDDITVGELAVSSEYVGTRLLEVTPRVVAGAIRTGLFTGRAGERMGWAHWTFAEFLAARYVIRNGLSTDQISDLVMHPDAKSTVVPQLRETAAWIAAMHAEFMNRVIADDPQVLLASKIVSADAATRERLTHAILRRYSELGDTAYDRNLSPRFDVLQHPNLGEQLRPYLLDKGRPNAVRRVVLDIIDACRVSALFDSLVELALDSTENWHLRHDAAFAISRLGSDAQKQKLKPLLDTTPEEDPEDELRGDALIALWPKHLSTEDALRYIDRDRHGSLFGTYTLFVVHHFLEGLKAEDLPYALRWAAAHPPHHGFPSEYGLGGKIMRRAWDHLDQPVILDAFAEAAISRIANHAQWFDDYGARSDVSLSDAPQGTRQAVLYAILEHAIQHQISLPRFWAVEARLIGPNDLPWLIEALRGFVGKPAEGSWVQLVRSAFDSSTPEHVDLILTKVPEISSLSEAFAPLFEPVELGSAAAIELQQSHRRRAEVLAASMTAKLPPVSDRVSKLLTTFEAGDLSAWWRLNVELARRGERSDDGEFVPDLTSLPSWTELDDRLQQRCVAAAERYVADGEANTERWLGTNTFYRPAAAGYRALRLLLHENPAALSSISADTWAKWSGIVVAFPESYGKDEIEITRELVLRAYTDAPEAVTHAVLQLIDRENEEHGSIFVLRKLDRCNDAAFAKALGDKVVSDLSLQPDAVGELLRQLLKRDQQAGTEAALKFVRRPGHGLDRDANRVKVAKTLIDFAPAESWHVIWSLVEDDHEFGRRLFSELAVEAHMSQVPKLSLSLEPGAVAKLFTWLEQTFPHTEDPKVQGGHVVESRESVGHYRDALLTGLRERGTEAGVAALRQLASDWPQISWLEYLVVDAERQRLRLSWDGVEPLVLFKMSSSRRQRLVESADQLLERVIDSLNRLQSRLRGETPAAPDLWDNDRPKDEDHFSGYIKRHLMDDLAGQGIIPNREVQIRVGQFTDIHVDAVRQKVRGDALDVVTVILEAKGCWNKGLKTSMQSQLRDRYLKDNRCRHGVYVIGWFLCETWNRKDYRRRQTPKLTFEEAREFFAQQAEELSIEGFTLRSYVLDSTLH